VEVISDKIEVKMDGEDVITTRQIVEKMDYHQHLMNITRIELTKEAKQNEIEEMEKMLKALSGENSGIKKACQKLQEKERAKNESSDS
jgi:hypothetical protein